MRGLRIRIGRRGTALLAAAWIYAWLGHHLYYYGRPLPPVAEGFWGAPSWAFVYFAVAFVCAVSAVARKDAWGFSAAAALSISWAAFYFFSWLDGSVDQTFAVHIWGAFGVLMLAVAGWRDE